jgi:hypothetical protein
LRHHWNDDRLDVRVSVTDHRLSGRAVAGCVGHRWWWPGGSGEWQPSPACRSVVSDPRASADPVGSRPAYHDGLTLFSPARYSSYQGCRPGPAFLPDWASRHSSARRPDDKPLDASSRIVPAFIRSPGNILTWLSAPSDAPRALRPQPIHALGETYQLRRSAGVSTSKSSACAT